MANDIQGRLAAIGTPTLSSQLIKHGLRQKIGRASCRERV